MCSKALFHDFPDIGEWKLDEFPRNQQLSLSECCVENEILVRHTHYSNYLENYETMI